MYICACKRAISSDCPVIWSAQAKQNIHHRHPHCINNNNTKRHIESYIYPLLNETNRIKRTRNVWTDFWQNREPFCCSVTWHFTIHGLYVATHKCIYIHTRTIATILFVFHFYYYHFIVYVVYCMQSHIIHHLYINNIHTHAKSVMGRKFLAQSNVNARFRLHEIGHWPLDSMYVVLLLLAVCSDKSTKLNWSSEKRRNNKNKWDNSVFRNTIHKLQLQTRFVPMWI